LWALPVLAIMSTLQVFEGAEGACRLRKNAGYSTMPDVKLPLPCEAYVGNEGYAFVSYAHRDSRLVYPELRALDGRGVRIWYDEGIDPGNEWPDEVARALHGASVFLVFVSQSAVESQNVRNEINFALNRKKVFIAIYLEDIQLPMGLELRMGDIQAVMRWRMSEEHYSKKVLSALPSIVIRGSNSEGATKGSILGADSPPLSRDSGVDSSARPSHGPVAENEHGASDVSDRHPMASYTFVSVFYVQCREVDAQSVSGSLNQGGYETALRLIESGSSPYNTDTVCVSGLAEPGIAESIASRLAGPIASKVRLEGSLSKHRVNIWLV